MANGMTTDVYSSPQRIERALLAVRVRNAVAVVGPPRLREGGPFAHPDSREPFFRLLLVNVNVNVNVNSLIAVRKAPCNCRPQFTLCMDDCASGSTQPNYSKRTSDQTTNCLKLA